MDKVLEDFKKEVWSLPEETLSVLREELESRFSLLFQRLNVLETTDLVREFVGNTPPQ